jgi:hypothetical protein
MGMLLLVRDFVARCVGNVASRREDAALGGMMIFMCNDFWEGSDFERFNKRFGRKIYGSCIPHLARL